MRGEFVDVDGRRLYYFAAGTRESGETILLVHGLFTSSHLWSELSGLIPRAHRLLVVDLLGHGRSDPPLEDDLGVTGHASRLVALLKTLRAPPVTIVAHAFGAPCALEMARAHPGTVSRLCLVSPTMPTLLPTRALRAASALHRVPGGSAPGLAHLAVRRMLQRGYVDRSRSAHSVDHYLRPFTTPEGGQGLAAQLVGAAARAPAPRGALAPLPAAIVWGSADPFVSSGAAHRLHSAIHGSTFHVVEGAGHFLPEESPERVAGILEALIARAHGSTSSTLEATE